MSELLPSRQAAQIRSGLVDYLTTTFALSDEEARTASAASSTTLMTASSGVLRRRPRAVPRGRRRLA